MEGPALVVLLLGDPHLLEGGERGQDGATDPDGVLALGGGDDLDLHGGGSKSGDLLLHAVGDTREHGGTTRLRSLEHSIEPDQTYQDNVAVEILADIDVALHDGVVGGLVDTSRSQDPGKRAGRAPRGTESLVTDGDDLAVRKLVGLLQAGRWQPSGSPARSRGRRSRASP